MIRTMSIAAALVAVVLGSSACASPDAAPTAPTPTIPTPTASSAPSPEAEPVAIPTDCTDIVDAAVYDATLAGLPLNDPAVVSDRHGAVEPVTSPPGSSPSTVLDDAAQLVCLWRDPNADITGLFLTLGTADPAVAEQRLDEMSAEGYVCESRLEGTQCQLAEVDETYGVDVATTAFLRDDVWLFVSQANVPTDDLIGAVVERLWS
jgi:hypothetical protein